MNKILEWTGSVMAIVYSLLIASNTGNEVTGFILLSSSALLFLIWGIRIKAVGFCLLQVFYIAAGLIGVYNWTGN